MKELIRETINGLKKKGVDYADLRRVKRISENIKVKNREVEGVSKSEDLGFGIRVLYKGAWGFASSRQLDGAEVDKYIGASLMRDEPEPLGVVEPLDGTYVAHGSAPKTGCSKTT